MTIKRTFLAAAAAASLLAGAAPVLAAELPVPLVMTSGNNKLRDQYAKAVFTVQDYVRQDRMVAQNDMTGSSMLQRATIRTAQKNFHHHILGYLRGGDYRILNASGDLRKRGLFAGSELPASLVTTGGTKADRLLTWGWDRPTVRDGWYDNNKVQQNFLDQRNTSGN